MTREQTRNFLAWRSQTFTSTKVEDPAFQENEWYREFQLVPPEVLFKAVELTKRRQSFSPSIADVRASLRTIYNETLLSLLDWHSLKDLDYRPKNAAELIATMRGIVPYAIATGLECVNIHEVPGILADLEMEKLEEKR